MTLLSRLEGAAEGSRSTDLDKAVERANYMVGNPSAWEDHDEGASEIIRTLLTALSTRDAELAAAREALERIAGRRSTGPWDEVETWELQDIAKQALGASNEPRT